MQSQTTRSLQQQDDASDFTIMGFLLDDPGPWSEDELARLFREPLSVKDGLNRLVAEGMVHRLDGFVFTTRIARQAHDIYQG